MSTTTLTPTTPTTMNKQTLPFFQPTPVLLPSRHRRLFTPTPPFDAPAIHPLSRSLQVFTRPQRRLGWEPTRTPDRVPQAFVRLVSW